MIQRIQSIFLLLAAVGLGLLFIESFDFATTSGEITTSTVLADGDVDINDYPIMMGLVGLGAVIFVAAIFLFKNRVLQSNIVKAGLLVVLVVFGFAGFYYGSNQTIAESANASLDFSFGWVGPVLALLFSLLALREISKDEKLVKSMDRLR